MKHTGKIVVAVFVGLAAAGSLFAQNGRRDRWGPPSPPSAAAETVTVSGPLELVNGQIAVVDSGKTYYAGQLIRLVGFIEGLKEGAQVTLKGNAVRYPSSADSYRLWITAMTLNGKAYENLDDGAICPAAMGTVGWLTGSLSVRGGWPFATGPETVWGLGKKPINTGPVSDSETGRLRRTKLG